MYDFLTKLFDPSDFQARWHSGWSHEHGWLHIIADTAIFGACATIPLSVAFYVLRKKQVLAFHRLYWLFAAFILSCGLCHLIEASIFWHPWYRLAGAMKMITAIASWAAVIALVRMMPNVLALPAYAQLAANLQNEVAERSRAEEEVRRLNDALRLRVEELQALFDVLPVGIGIASDPTGSDIRVNRAFAQMLRTSVNANASLNAEPGVAPTHFKVFSGGRELAPHELPIQSAAQRAVLIHEIEEEIVFVDGQRLHLLASAAPLYDADGKVRGSVGAFVDITARKHAEQERQRVEKKLQETQKLESLGVLAGGIAHDFNNLLTGVVGNASLARMELPPTSSMLPYFDEIEEAAMRAADLCKQMLAYAGKGRFVIQDLDLSELVRDTTQLLQSSLTRGVVLKFNLEDRLPAVSGDATQLRQIVMNLVINASEAIGSRGGGVTLSTGFVRADRAYLEATVGAAADLPEGDYVHLEVSDNGCGMSAETLAKIFDPFFTTKFTGRGLGLAAVLGIVRGHKGALKVYSEPGHGTSFKILLPCTAARATPPVITDSGTDLWRGSGTVLVVDDEETVRITSTRMLESLGFTVLTANDGREGVERFREQQENIRAVLLDLTMPHLDGEAAFHELRKLRPEVRVLLMSGFSEQEAINRFLGKGLAGFLQKPFRLESLRARMRDMLA